MASKTSSSHLYACILHFAFFFSRAEDVLVTESLGMHNCNKATAIRYVFVFLNVHCVMILGKMPVYKFVSLKLYVIAAMLCSVLYFSLVLLFACIACN